MSDRSTLKLTCSAGERCRPCGLIFETCAGCVSQNGIRSLKRRGSSRRHRSPRKRRGSKAATFLSVPPTLPSALPQNKAPVRKQTSARSAEVARNVTCVTDREISNRETRRKRKTRQRPACCVFLFLIPSRRLAALCFDSLLLSLHFTAVSQSETKTRNRIL